MTIDRYFRDKAHGRMMPEGTALMHITAAILPHIRSEAERQVRGGVHFVHLHSWVEALRHSAIPIVTPYFMRGFHDRATELLHRFRRPTKIRKALPPPVRRVVHGFVSPSPEIDRYIRDSVYDFAESTIATLSRDIKDASDAVRRELGQAHDERETREKIVDRMKRIFNDPHRAAMIGATECLTGDSLICGANVRAVFRRWYRGPMVKVVTKHGLQLTGSLNHPVLTQRGMVPLGQLDKSDRLVYDRNSIKGATKSSPARVSGDVNEEHPPSTINEMFDSLSTIGVRSRTRTGKPDFHGDVTDSYVDVAALEGTLRYGWLASPKQLVKDGILSPSLTETLSVRGDGHLFGHFLSEDRSLFGGSQGDSNPGQFAHNGTSRQSKVRGNLDGTSASDVFHNNVTNGNTLLVRIPVIGTLGRHFEGHEVTSDRHASMLAGGNDSAGVAVEKFGYSTGTESRLIEASHLLSHGDGFWSDAFGYPEADRVLFRARYARRLDDFVDGTTRTVVASSDNQGACSSRIAFDDIATLVVIEEWSGHVYNLETEDGYYNANGLYTKNSARAVNAGAYSAAITSGIVSHVVWRVDENPCSHCKDLDGQQRKLGEPFMVLDNVRPANRIVLHPPLHPHCLCSTIDVLDLDLIRVPGIEEHLESMTRIGQPVKATGPRPAKPRVWPGGFQADGFYWEHNRRIPHPDDPLKGQWQGPWPHDKRF